MSMFFVVSENLRYPLYADRFIVVGDPEQTSPTSPTTNELSGTPGIPSSQPALLW